MTTREVFKIRGLLGPDESKFKVDNNAYENLAAMSVLRAAIECAEGPSAAASPEASARSRRQSLQETISRRFCPAPAEQPLALSEGRSLVLPTPNLSWGFSGDLPGVVQVDAISRGLLNSLAESDGPSLSAPRDGLPRCQPGAGQRPDRRERSEPRPEPGLGTKVPEA